MSSSFYKHVQFPLIQPSRSIDRSNFILVSVFSSSGLSDEHRSDGEDGAEGQSFGEHHSHPVHQQQEEVQPGVLCTGRTKGSVITKGSDRSLQVYWNNPSLVLYSSGTVW